jgi:uncharacterized membrane protein YjgN (DUF898 family)
MAERIGNVLYWLGCAVAALIVMAGVAVYVTEGHSRSDGISVFIGFLVAAFIPWVVGRALRYILAAR